MDELTRLWADLVGRLTGPLTFRLILQPLMAMFYGIRDGVKDAHEGHPLYFWSIFTGHGSWALLGQGARSVGRVILLGFVMDFIYQLIVFRWIYPVELVIVVLILAFVPYLLIRGPANRFARLLQQSRDAPTR